VNRGKEKTSVAGQSFFLTKEGQWTRYKEGAISARNSNYSEEGVREKSGVVGGTFEPGGAFFLRKETAKDPRGDPSGSRHFKEGAILDKIFYPPPP